MDPKSDHSAEDPPERKRKNVPDGDPEQWRNLPATRGNLLEMFRIQRLPESAWDTAQQIAGMVPSQSDWMRYLDRTLTGMGTIFLLTGIVFFFAFNWDDLSRWYRFGIVQGAVIISTSMVFVLNIDRWAGRLALGTSTILLGVALVVISQEYQTGADSYRLFLMWLLLISGWVLISQWNVMYLIWMVLLNITIVLYWDQVVYSNWQTLNLIVFVLNAGFVLLWELFALKLPLRFMIEGRWFLYLIMLIALVHGTYLVCDYVFATYSPEYDTFVTYLAPVTYAIFVGLMLFTYVSLRPDLLMLTGLALSLLVVGIVWIGNGLWKIMPDFWFDNLGTNVMYFLLMGIITVALTGALVTGLRSLNQRWMVDHA